MENLSPLQCSVHRVIPLRVEPERVIAHIRATSCLMRQQHTAFRGAVAFVGSGSVWAVAILREVKRASSGRDCATASRFLWCFEDLHEVKLASSNASVGIGDEQAMFFNCGGLQPQLLCASLQADLNRALGLTPPHLKEATLAVATGSVSVVTSDSQGQLPLF